MVRLRGQRSADALPIDSGVKRISGGQATDKGAETRILLALSGGFVTRPLCLRDRHFVPVSPTTVPVPLHGTAGILLSPTTGVLTRAREAVHRRERARSGANYTPVGSDLLEKTDRLYGPAVFVFALYVESPSPYLPVDSGSRLDSKKIDRAGSAVGREDQGGDRNGFFRVRTKCSGA